MLYTQTVINIVDNSGGFLALCIRILKSQARSAVPGDVVSLSVKSILLNKKIRLIRKRKVLKGHVYQAVVLRTSTPTRRFGNVYLRSKGNAVAILGK